MAGPASLGASSGQTPAKAARAVTRHVRGARALLREPMALLLRAAAMEVANGRRAVEPERPLVRPAPAGRVLTTRAATALHLAVALQRTGEVACPKLMRR